MGFGGAVDAGGAGGYEPPRVASGLGDAEVVGCRESVAGTLQLPLSHLNKGELFFREGARSVNTLPNKRWGILKTILNYPD